MQQSGTAGLLIPAWFSVQRPMPMCANGRMSISILHLAPVWRSRYGCGGRSVRAWRQGALAALLCAGWAAADELHQYFVPGRAMLAGDVAVDALGFLPGIFVVLLLTWLWRRRKS